MGAEGQVDGHVTFHTSPLCVKRMRFAVIATWLFSKTISYSSLIFASDGQHFCTLCPMLGTTSSLVGRHCGYRLTWRQMNTSGSAQYLTTGGMLCDQIGWPHLQL